MHIRHYLAALMFCLCALAISGQAQTTGTLRGKVALTNGDPVHNVKVTIIQLKLSTETAEDGAYEFKNVPPGKYDISAHLERTPDILAKAEIAGGQTVTADFEIRLEAVREQITVTATGNEETTFNSIQSVTIIGSLDLAKKNPISLGEALDHELGVAKRSFGPGSSRPVVRGFDGDRVLVLQEGIGIGGLGFHQAITPNRLICCRKTALKSSKAPQRCFTAATPLAAWSTPSAATTKRTKASAVMSQESAEPPIINSAAAAA